MWPALVAAASSRSPSLGSRQPCDRPNNGRPFRHEYRGLIAMLPLDFQSAAERYSSSVRVAGLMTEEVYLLIAYFRPLQSPSPELNPSERDDDRDQTRHNRKKKDIHAIGPPSSRCILQRRSRQYHPTRPACWVASPPADSDTSERGSPTRTHICVACSRKLRKSITFFRAGCT